jgi:hypothetical protein
MQRTIATSSLLAQALELQIQQLSEECMFYITT